MTRRLSTFGAASILMMWLTPTSPAQAQTGFAKTGAYIGFLASPGATFEGTSFDGDHFLYDTEQIVLIPRVSSGDGLGLVFGGRSDTSGGEVTYVQAEHRASFAGLRGVAKSRIVTIDGKRFFISKKRVQPYITGGTVIPWLTVEKGAASMTEETDATFVGVGFHGGGGVTGYLHRRIAISAGYTYRFVFFPRVKGTTGSFVDIDPSAWPISRNGNATASVSFTF
jgi:hypothetical protein